MTSGNAENFIQWFKTSGGFIDLEAMGIMDFPPAEGGRGAVALKDLPEGHTLFTIPREITLSTRTSQLPELFGQEEWKQLKLHEGWAGLMLCMMWEVARGKESPWAGYLDILPSKFDTPMFWREDELSELSGTSITEKLGKDDAERDYESKVRVAITSKPALFSQGEAYYSLERFHCMGSRILSRSFTVENWQPEGDEDPEQDEPGNNESKPAAQHSDNDAMDVDDHPPQEDHHENEDEDDEDADDASDIAMVPMADMLNARFGTENAKLFHEKEALKMITTKPIKVGEQIWNTYGDLPNAELLRRYGHVDLLPLANGRLGNPGDVVEMAADIIVEAVKQMCQASDDLLAERIDWWLEQGGDDVFELDLDLELPPGALSLVKLLLLPDGEWIKARDKGKPPKPKAEPDNLRILEKALEKRCAEYPTSIQDDEARLQGDVSLNVRNAIIVRLGEKYILQGVLTKVKASLQKDKDERAAPKRKSNSQGDETKKRSKR